ncbi:hypothetical protein BZA05DRAFT_403475 [Tricharina praecox]|uniref:uncharacterized protein n=1 Tax=Tricharina praecox TaxID=43433 RepID=UPI00222077ED|nr:uncharacterized protein BZA05DRAFT_403475 [Tricharina praecox]KAI5848254.1 hypothetical protein BZA05DRAFT_403475 [Tricharina praecox]
MQNSQPAPPPPPPPPLPLKEMTTSITSPRQSASSSGTSWQAKFAQGLAARDRREKAFDEIISAYSTLAIQLRSSQPARADAERARLERRCKDYAEEARERERLLQKALDEQVAQELELNMAYEREKALKEDNAELLDRWMKLKKKEADEMNLASQW